MAPSDSRLLASIALTRFGLGAKPGEIDTVARDAQAWLDGQIRTTGAPQPAGEFPNSSERVLQYAGYRDAASNARQIRRQDAPATPAAASASAPAAMAPAMGTESTENSQAQAAFDARRMERRNLMQDTAQEFLARAQLGATTPEGFAVRWALFWSNALTVSAVKFPSAVFMGQYEREAIRPHVFGPFADLLVAAEQHPAMLLYLDQAQSVGPNSTAGQRRSAGLNENLAREILELHTVGAEGGYSQADVTEFARALTGWSLEGQAGNRAGSRGGQNRRPNARRAALVADQPGQNGFAFRPILHEPGARTVMGRHHSEGGEEQGEAILRDLATRPQTAKRLARRIAVHFVADDPPPALVAALEKAWLSSNGRLDVVARALIAAPEAWALVPAKVKTPYDFVVSTHRALGTTPQRPQGLQPPLIAMGQPAFSAPSPEGWPDTAADWAGPDALVKRLEWASTVADVARDQREPVQIAEAALGARLSDRTRTAVSRAESRPEALTLFLMSPEFQRR